MKQKIIIATVKSWNISNAERFKEMYKEKYDTYIFTSQEELTYKSLESIAPRYIFLPHWSWIIPEDIYKNIDCVVFHLTDLPYGRGGSPLQNLILNKVYDTKISAIRVSGGIDTGNIYIKEDFHVGKGSAEEILSRASEIIFFKMIPYILKNVPIPYQQEGDVVKFKRRTPDESDMGKASLKSINDFYDFIRMLDGEGYPNAYINMGSYKIIFSDAHIETERVTGRFEVIADNEKDINCSCPSR